ncbi:protein kinase [Lutibacter sp. B2]|nr:protein kinase [Lutibacter sp. B2]
MRKLLERFNLNKIKDYVFQKEIGGGNMSATAMYKNSEGEHVLVKFLLYPRNKFELDRFYQEVSSMKKILSINPDACIPKLITEVVQIEDTQIYYFMMEYIDGIPLSNIIDSSSEILTNINIARIMRDLTSIVCDSLSSGILHKDIHPGNILICNNETNDYKSLVLLDFGVSEYWWKSHCMGSVEDAFRHIGAVSAWSPEFIENPKEISVSHDIWGLGVLFYRLITKGWPLSSESFGEYMNKIRGNILAELALDQIEDKYFCYILRRCFERNPWHRITSANLYKILNDYVSGRIEIISKNEQIFEMYKNYDGDLWVCTRCMQVTHPTGNMCTKCGNRDDEYLPLEYCINFG